MTGASKDTGTIVRQGIADAKGWLLLGLAVSAVLFVRAMPHWPLRGSRPQTKPAAVADAMVASAHTAAATVGTPTTRTETVYVRRLITRPIETIQVGQRVLGTNPNPEEVEEFEESGPKTWRTIEVEQIKPSGKRLYATLLRPLEWIEEELDPESNTLELDLPELGAEGPARVVRIGPCPPIASGPGHIVTATFKHEPDGELLTVTIATHQAGSTLGTDAFTSVAGTEEIGYTANHPFWSEDRQAFVEAAELRQGEHVRIRPDEVAAVVSIKPRPPTAWVYNLEVQGEHVYEVSACGILVHNWCFTVSKFSEDWAQKGLHVYVGKVDVAVAPGPQGGYVFRKAFASTPDKEFVHAVRALNRELEKKEARKEILRKAEKGLEYLRLLATGSDSPARIAQERARELELLIGNLRKAWGM